MSLNTKEKPKKEKKKDNKSTQLIPDSLQNAPEPQIKDEVEPPRPISFQDAKGDVPKPTRLPPRFKERFQPKHPKTEEVKAKEVSEATVEEKESPELSTNKKILPPVSIRHR